MHYYSNIITDVNQSTSQANDFLMRIFPCKKNTQFNNSLNTIIAWSITFIHSLWLEIDERRTLWYTGSFFSGQLKIILLFHPSLYIRYRRTFHERFIIASELHEGAACSDTEYTTSGRLHSHIFAEHALLQLTPALKFVHCYRKQLFQIEFTAHN